jgi:DNA repair photolyase
MILSVSRRTDIPAFYAEWFFNRLQAGYVLVRNPLNYHQVSRVLLTPEVIDCIVFWTKNPLPMLDKLDLLKDYKYYFQITLTPYEQEIEPGVPAKAARIQGFKQLSGKIGKERTIWRYDPIILTDQMDIEYHCRQFEALAEELSAYTSRCIISFMDMYRKIEQSMRRIAPKAISEQDMLVIGRKLSNIAGKYNLKMEACSEAIDLAAADIMPASCIDARLIGELLGRDIRISKDRNQRAICGCAASIDIGAYNTCRHGCVYCYANFSQNAVEQNCSKHDFTAPMLIGNIEPEDKINERKVEVYRKGQLALF